MRREVLFSQGRQRNGSADAGTTFTLSDGFSSRNRIHPSRLARQPQLDNSGLLIAGRIRRLRLLRLMGLALLSLTTLKVFIWDLSSLDRAYRIISFIMLGAILLVVSYFYQRSQQRAAEK